MRKASACGASRATSARVARPEFRHQGAVGGDEAGQSLGDGKVHGQALQVPVVDADQRRSQGHGAPHLGLVMRLDEHVHAERVRRREHRPRLVVVQHRKHGENRVRARGPRLRDLAGVDHEILGEDRSVEHRANRRQVRQRAAEEGSVRQHADRVGRAGIGHRLLRGIDPGADRAFRR